MRDVGKGYHCVYQIHYHMVFPVKYRKGLLSEEITHVIKEIGMEIEQRHAIEVEQIRCDRNYIHVLCGAHPKYAPGKLGGCSRASQRESYSGDFRG